MIQKLKKRLETALKTHREANLELDAANVPRRYSNGKPMTLKDRCEWLVETYNRNVLKEYKEKR